MHSCGETCFWICTQLASHLLHCVEWPISPTALSVLQYIPFMFMAGNTTDILGRLPLLWLVAGSRRWSCKQRGGKYIYIFIWKQFFNSDDKTYWQTCINNSQQQVTNDAIVIWEANLPKDGAIISIRAFLVTKFFTLRTFFKLRPIN